MWNINLFLVLVLRNTLSQLQPAQNLEFIMSIH